MNAGWLYDWRESHQNARAFTLIELLVVTTLIALLASLLLPTLSKVRESSRSARCRSNVRQIGSALQMYVNDSGYYPPSYTPTAAGGVWFFPDLLRAYTGNGWLDPLYRCPGYAGAVSNGVAIASYPLGAYVPLGSYGYNNEGWHGETDHQSWQGLAGLSFGLPASQWPTAQSLLPGTSVSIPSDMLSFGDSVITTPDGQSWPFSHGPTGLSPVFFYGIRVDDLWRPALDRADLHRHRKFYNMAFCDGHVEGIRRRDLFSTNAISMRRWNSDHQAHEEVVPYLERFYKPAFRAGPD